MKLRRTKILESTTKSHLEDLVNTYISEKVTSAESTEVSLAITLMRPETTGFHAIVRYTALIKVYI